jgi:hypothetical protein
MTGNSLTFTDFSLVNLEFRELPGILNSDCTANLRNVSPSHDQIHDELRSRGTGSRHLVPVVQYYL